MIHGQFEPEQVLVESVRNGRIGDGNAGDDTVYLHADSSRWAMRGDQRACRESHAAM